MSEPIRLRCLVLGCNHTRGQRKHDRTPIQAWQEWVCGDHWKAVPRAFRKAHARAWRRWQAAWERGTDGRFSCFADLREYMDAKAAEMRLWARCKRAAIERAVGIG